ncbi:MAG: hypothetical protein ABIH21_01450 [Patescibacteria group bacterium]
MLPSIRSLLRDSFNYYKQNSATLAGFAAWLLLPFAALVLIEFIQNDAVYVFVGGLISIIEIILSLWILIILILTSEKIIKKKELDISNLQNRAKLLLPSLAFVMILELVIILGGFVLLIIPGLLFIIWFSYVEFAVVLDNKKGMGALTMSRNQFKNRFWLVAWKTIAGPMAIFFVYVIVISIVLSIIGTVLGLDLQNTVFGETPPIWADIIATVSQIFLIPWIVLYTTILYIDLKKNESKNNS